MHFHPLIAVVADDLEEAQSLAEEVCDDWIDNLCDYYQLDEDRWEGAVAICYADDPEKFEEELRHCQADEQEARKYAVEQLRKARAALDSLQVGNALTEQEERNLGDTLVLVGKPLGRWQCDDMAFYDAEAHATSWYDGVVKRCKDDPDRQWLVAVDLHC